MRVAALLLAVAAATAWGFGGILLKRGVTVVSPTTILVFQYVLGVVVLGGWVVATGGASGGIDSVRDRWQALAVISVLQITGYVCFTLAVRHAGADSIPTSAAIAIAASYPALVAVLSGPLLDESLGWHQVVGVALVVGGVIVSQL